MKTFEGLLFQLVYAAYKADCDGVDRVAVCQDEFLRNEWQDAACRAAYVAQALEKCKTPPVKDGAAVYLVEEWGGAETNT